MAKPGLGDTVFTSFGKGVSWLIGQPQKCWFVGAIYDIGRNRFHPLIAATQWHSGIILTILEQGRRTHTFTPCWPHVHPSWPSSNFKGPIQSSLLSMFIQTQGTIAFNSIDSCLYQSIWRPWAGNSTPRWWWLGILVDWCCSHQIPVVLLYHSRHDITAINISHSFIGVQCFSSLLWKDLACHKAIAFARCKLQIVLVASYPSVFPVWRSWEFRETTVGDASIHTQGMLPIAKKRWADHRRARVHAVKWNSKTSRQGYDMPQEVWWVTAKIR